MDQKSGTKGAAPGAPTTSAAKRLRKVFAHFGSFSGNKSLHVQWAKIYGIAPADPSQPQMVSTDVARQLSLVSRQIDLVEKKLKAQHPSLSANTTTNQTHRLRLLLANSLSNLQAPWASLQGELTPDLVKSLEFWDEMIECDEYEIADVSLKELETLLLEAETLAEKSESPELASILLQVIALMRRAIRDNAIAGPEEFLRSARDACATILDNADLIRENSEKVEVSTLGKAWKRFEEICSPILFADALLTAGGRLKIIAEQVMKLLSNG